MYALVVLTSFSYFPAFLTIYFFYFGIITLAIKKDPRRLPYYGKLTDEEKNQLDIPRLIRIDSILYLCLASLSVCIFIINTFTTMRGFTPITNALLGLIILLAIILISKIPLIMSKKK
jgi:hypothetical protein